MRRGEKNGRSKADRTFDDESIYGPKYDRRRKDGGTKKNVRFERDPFENQDFFANSITINQGATFDDEHFYPTFELTLNEI